jgi:hypothetical protein
MEVKIVELTTHQAAGKSELNKPIGKQSLLEHLPSTQVICDLKGYLRPNVSVGLCPGKGDSDYTGKQQIQLVNTVARRRCPWHENYRV